MRHILVLWCLLLVLLASSAPAQVVCVPLSGNLPPGVVLQGDGTFVGTPTTAGTWTATIKCAAPGAIAAQQEYTFVVAPALPVVKIGVTTLPAMTVGVAISISLKVTVGPASPVAEYDVEKNRCAWNYLLQPLLANPKASTDSTGYADCIARTGG